MSPEKVEPIEVHNLLLSAGVPEAVAAKIYGALARAWSGVGDVAADDETRLALASVYWGSLVGSLGAGVRQ